MFFTHRAAARLTSILTDKHNNLKTHTSLLHKLVTTELCVPLLCERLVHAVQDDVNTLRLRRGQKGRRFFIEEISAVKEGNGGQVNWTQFSQTAACCRCRKKKRFGLLKITEEPDLITSTHKTSCVRNEFHSIIQHLVKALLAW